MLPADRLKQKFKKQIQSYQNLWALPDKLKKEKEKNTNLWVFYHQPIEKQMGKKEKFGGESIEIGGEKINTKYANPWVLSFGGY